MRILNESGRSMVEILGVLAIIGVLSVMGISGYTTAMKKHQANTLFEEALRRAISVSGQLSVGVEAPTLREFQADATYGTFGTAINQLSGDKFKLSIHDLNKGLCQHLQKMGEESDVVNYVEADCTNGTLGLIYNNDLR